MRAEIDSEDTYSGWYPETLVYLGHFHSPFEIFARSKSKSYFDKVKCLLNISHMKELESLFEAYSTGARRLPKWNYNSINPKILLGYDRLNKSV